MGPTNEQILKTYLYPGIDSPAEVNVLGYRDMVGLEDRSNMVWLNKNRAVAVVKAIRENVPLLVLLMASALSLNAQPSEPLPPGHDLIPVLPYVFFDSGSAVIPERYVLFGSFAETTGFVDTAVVGDEIAQHHQMRSARVLVAWQEVWVDGDDVAATGVWSRLFYWGDSRTLDFRTPDWRVFIPPNPLSRTKGGAEKFAYDLLIRRLSTLDSQTLD